MEDKTIHQLVLEQLEFEPSIDAEHIGVAVENGVVTLSGHVGSYMQKVEAERAAQRVKGVKAIALEIDVRTPLRSPSMMTRLPNVPPRRWRGASCQRTASKSACRSVGSF